MITVAKAFDTGIGLPEGKTRCWISASKMYEAVATQTAEDREGDFDAVMDDPLHTIVARRAHLLVEGGFGLEKDPNRAGKYIL